MADVPYLVDGDGFIVLPMPGAYAEIKFLKRGATITWEQEHIGKISIAVQCDNKVKYDKLALLLPKPQPVKTEKKKKKQKKKQNKFNTGIFQSVDLHITQQDLDTNLGRFRDGYSFEGVCANILSAMGYEIRKGYDVRTKQQLGATTSDMGVDIVATKGNKYTVVQCKHWQNQCGGPDVNKTIGAASTHHGDNVLMICTGGFTSQAREVAKQSSMKVVLWNWEMVQANIKKHLL